jgi:hypothetical protein
MVERAPHARRIRIGTAPVQQAVSSRSLRSLTHKGVLEVTPMTRQTRPTQAMLAIALVVVGCTTTAPASPSAGESAVPRTSAPAASPSGETALVPQPEPPRGLEVAPDHRRVDLEMPTFSNPTDVTNPLFPVSSQRSVLLTGTVEGQAFRTEVTLLPITRILEWEGQRVELLVSQYVAFLGGRLHEVAYDLYAQADDGSVWYFGEDVFNFADGAIVDTHGSWIAGVDGPAAMIMPADPQVGDVYRPENTPGLVFEEVTVSSVGETFDGPLGRIEGGIVVSELHMDGGMEDKQFAPAYGEFFTASGGDTEGLAMAVPTDASTDAEPDQLATLLDETRALLDALADGDRDRVATARDEITTAHDSYPADQIPAQLRPLVQAAVERLSKAVTDGRDAATGQAAVDLRRLALDLALRYRPQPEIEVGRYDLWLAQLQLDAVKKDAAVLNWDYFALDYVRERFVSRLEPRQAAELNLGMEELLTAIADEEFDAAVEIATDMRQAAKDFSPSD